MYSGIKPKVNRKDYPCLMQDSQGNVFLVRSPSSATLIYREPEAIMNTHISKVGDFGVGLNLSHLRPFVGEITLGEN